MISILPRILFLFFVGHALGDVIVPVDEYGAVPDGVTDSTSGFLAAWTATCGSDEPATMSIEGNYMIKNIVFSGPCNSSLITVQINGTVFAPLNYTEVGNSGHWILFRNIVGICISGGVIDGNGAGYWACKDSGNCTAVGARSVTLNGVENGVICGLTSNNSQNMHIVVNSSNNVTITNVQVLAPADSPNTDGIHIEASDQIFISDAIIQTGDDCISIGPATRNVYMQNVECGPGHGVSIGSLGRTTDEVGVQNVTLSNSKFINSTNGVRIKTWAQPSQSYAQDITYSNIIMENVDNPILIDQNYCPHGECPHGISGVQISEVSYFNISGTSATQLAIDFNCSSTNPCTDITIQDVDLTYEGMGTATSLCNNVNGTSNGAVLPAVYFSS